MSKKNLCRMILTTDQSNREIAARLNFSHNTVGRYRERLAEEGITWEDAKNLSEIALDARLNNGRERSKKKFAEPDWSRIREELHRPGVTMTLLYEEYATGLASGQMSEREFRRRYERYSRTLGLVMRQVRRPGEQLFVDYSGKRPSITNRETGEKTPVELWVGVLGSSRKSFAYCTPTQQLPDWIDAHVRALEYFGAAPRFVVPDNLKSAVVSISRKEGHYINPTYQAFADHYDIIVMPTRRYRPKDKAAVEAGVRLAQMWILARLRNREFFSIDELNRAVADLLVRLNTKAMRSRGGKSRNELFLELDLPAMRPLPRLAFEFADWKLNVSVPKDYHVLCESNYYSVPHHLITEKVNLRLSASTVEAYRGDQLVSMHKRSFGIDGIFTKPEHQPPAHRMYGQEQMDDLVSWADTAGQSVREFMQKHVQLNLPGASVQASRGLKQLAREVGTERLDQACARALRMNAVTMSSIRSMLQRGIENTPLRTEAANEPLAAHENVRGASHYQ